MDIRKLYKIAVPLLCGAAAGGIVGVIDAAVQGHSITKGAIAGAGIGALWGATTYMPTTSEGSNLENLTLVIGLLGSSVTLSLFGHLSTNAIFVNVLTSAVIGNALRPIFRSHTHQRQNSLP